MVTFFFFFNYYCNKLNSEQRTVWLKKYMYDSQLFIISQCYTSVVPLVLFLANALKRCLPAIILISSPGF